ALDPFHQLRLIRLAQGRPQARKTPACFLFHRWKMLRQDQGRGADADEIAALEPRLQFRQFAKKRLDGREERRAFLCQLKRASMVQLDAQSVLEVVDLLAQGRLLFAQGFCRVADALLPRHVVKQLQLMDVHAAPFTFASKRSRPSGGRTRCPCRSRARSTRSPLE